MSQTQRQPEDKSVAVVVESGAIVGRDLRHDVHIVSGVVIIHESDYELVHKYGWRQCPPPSGNLVDGFITVMRR